MRKRIAAAMPYVKDDYDIALHGEQDAVTVLPASIEQLPYLIRKFFVLRRERAARGKLGERSHGFMHPAKPAQARFARTLLP